MCPVKMFPGFLLILILIQSGRGRLKLEGVPGPKEKFSLWHVAGMREIKAKIFKPHVGHLVLSQYDIHKGNLNCVAVGHPLPKIKWLHNGKTMSDHKWYNHQYGAYKVESIIKFPTAHQSDRGIYTCIATNKLASDHFDFVVDVPGSPIGFQ